MRRAARVDANHGKIVKALRQAGCSVADLSPLGDGIPDILVGKGRRNILMEIKDGDLPPSERELTPKQIEFHIQWRGQVAVVNSVDEALLLVFSMEQP